MCDSCCSSSSRFCWWWTCGVEEGEWEDVVAKNESRDARSACAASVAIFTARAASIWGGRGGRCLAVGKGKRGAKKCVKYNEE